MVKSIYIEVYCTSFLVEELQSVGLSVAIHRFLGVISLTQGIINGIKQFYSLVYRWGELAQDVELPNVSNNCLS